MFQGARDTLPMILAAIPFGALYGALAQAADLSLWVTTAMSLFVFAGSSQFVAVNMLLLGTPGIVIVIATFFINLRHLMYSANLLEQVKHYPAPLRALMAFWLTDETFAVVSARLNTTPSHEGFHFYYLGSALFMYLNWQACSVAGYLLGAQIDDPLAWGLDIAMVVAFIGVIAPRLTNLPMWSCAIAAFFIALITKDWPYNSGLIFTMISAIGLAMLVSHYQRQRHNE